MSERALRRRRIARESNGGEAGIRTLGTTLRSYNGLANRRLQPLGHLTLRPAQLARSELQLAIIRLNLMSRQAGAHEVPNGINRRAAPMRAARGRHVGREP